MSENELTVRELREDDISYIVQYWLGSEDDHLVGMGVDLAKMPTEDGLTQMLTSQINLSYPEKQSYCIIWELNGKAIGHCNINKIQFGEEAFMHLHLWNVPTRQKGMGLQLVKMSLPYFFNNYKLRNLFCEPYALNPAPNKTLKKIGFTFVKKHVTIPGSLNFEQEVNRWCLSSKDFDLLKQ